MDDSAAPAPPGRPLPSRTRKVKSDAAPPENKQPAVWRKYVSWSLMVVLGIAAVIEFYAQFHYRKTLKVCQDALEKVEGKTAAEATPVTFDQLKDRFSSTPVYTKGYNSYAESGIYTWTWQGLRRYKVRLFVHPKDGTVWDVGSEP